MRGLKSEKGKILQLYNILLLLFKNIEVGMTTQMVFLGKRAQNSRCYSMCLSVFKDFPTIKENPHSFCLYG